MSSALPRRRNGKPQACEPCRKRKIACDHGLPVCQRCKRRKTALACIYLAAPMTQKSDLEQSIPSLASLPVLDIDSPRLSKQSPHSSNSAIKSANPTILTNSSVFFGPTSFSAVFHENQQDLEPALSSEEDAVGNDYELQQKADIDIDALDAHFIQLGTKVLSRLPDQLTCNLLLKRRFANQDTDGWFKPATQLCADLLWSTYGKYLRRSCNQSDFETVARILCKNGRTPLQEPDDPEDPKDWIYSFSGKQLRWEALGTILTTCCYGAMSSPDTDIFTSRDSRRKEKHHFVQEMQEGISICMTLCSHTESVNPVMVSLLYNNNLLLSVLGPGGDTSFLLWRHHGDLLAALTALGLHRESESRSSQINIRSEVRRRIYAAVFSIDKTLASFTGRPPFLSHRYTSCPMPLDIDDEVLLMPAEDRARVIAKLDSNGWNAEGRITSVTYLRSNLYLANIRDEILEISLGSWNECLPNCIYGLRAKSEKMYSEFPPAIIFREDDLTDATISSRTISIKLSTRTKYLQNHFLLERLAIKYGQTDGQALIDIARETLSLTLFLYTERDRFRTNQHNFEWLVSSPNPLNRSYISIVCYGVPSSGVLCFELLKQAKNPQPQTPRLHLPRSETIQNLSLFIGFLSWVRPKAANYEICCRMKQIISRVLDQVLEGPSQKHAEIHPCVGFDLPGDLFDFDAFGDFDLLGEPDWMKAPWVGLTPG